MLVREFSEGADVEAVLLVRAVERRERRGGGGEFLRLQLADRTGRVVGCVWDRVAEIAPHARVATVVHVTGRFERHARFGPQVAVRTLRPAAPGSFSLEDLLDGPPRSAEQLEADLRELLATIREPHLARLLDRFFRPGSLTWERFRVAPAAKTFHHAYRHGLLEHCLTVAQGVSAISATFPGIDRDVAVTGALLHDIGKLEAYTADPLAHDLTDMGRLQGEIPLGYYRVRREIEDLPAFPPDLAQAVLHIILSHHGALEHGSPVRPCTREATLVHFLDNLGGRLGSFDRLEKELPDGASWSAFDRALGAGAYFGVRDEQVREAA
ncbi:MAG TPA: HD domain-containing protein [Solirubrobacteraceae bacterium]|nr:HD domain-containing protein [Solirubrobacteraceae bacterium]